MADESEKTKSHAVRGAGTVYGGYLLGALAGSAVGAVGGAALGKLLPGLLPRGVRKGVADVARMAGRETLARHPSATAAGYIGGSVGSAAGAVVGGGKAMQHLTRDAKDKDRFAARHPYVAGLGGPISGAYVGHTLEKKHAQENSMILSEQMKLAAPFGGKQAAPFGKKKDEKGDKKKETKKDEKKEKRASLAEQMKTAVIGGALAGGLGTAAVEAFLKRNPHLLDSVLGEGFTHAKLPKGMAGLGAVAGGVGQYAAEKSRENG